MATADAQRSAVERMRSRVLNAPKLSMSQIHKLTARIPLVKGPFTHEQVSLPAPDEVDLEERLWEVVEHLRVEGEKIEKPRYSRILNAEWTDPSPRGDVVGDWTFSLPSNTRNTNTDILLGEPWLQADFPPDSIWPTDPPRGEAFCDPTALCHPLISSAMCSDWTGAPLMWICCGEETIADSIMLIAQTAARQGVRVDFTQYEGMPHNFPRSVETLPQALHAYDSWAAACTTSVCGGQTGDSRAAVFGLGELKPAHLDVRRLTNLARDQAFEMMKMGRAKKMANIFTGRGLGQPSRI
ncbi:MAG: hypothetical protein Q9160_008496 [Pyrenula sp. 1 TL-2023]